MRLMPASKPESSRPIRPLETLRFSELRSVDRRSRRYAGVLCSNLRKLLPSTIYTKIVTPENRSTPHLLRMFA
jgi:hypothetical protein